MGVILVTVALTALLFYLYSVHTYYRRQKQICGTYPYFRLRDEIVWKIIQGNEQAPENERFYSLLNRIVNKTDRFGWRFISEVAQEVTHAVLAEQRPPSTPPSSLEVALISLVIESSKANSLVVRLALTKPGRFLLLYPVVKACYAHFRRNNPNRDSALTRRMETVRRIRRLDNWMQIATTPAAEPVLPR